MEESREKWREIGGTWREIGGRWREEEEDVEKSRRWDIQICEEILEKVERSGLKLCSIR